MLEQAEKCQGCGNPLEETTDDSLHHEWEEVPGWCNACERMNTARDTERADHADTSGRFWSVRRRS